MPAVVETKAAAMMRYFFHSLIVLIVAGSILCSPPAGSARIAAHYAPGVMERVSRVRGLPQAGCMIASPTEPIGTWVRVRGLRTGATRLCRVTDTSAPQDRLRHIRKRQIELDWPSARAICNIRRVGQEPPWRCPVWVSRAGPPS